MATIGSRTITLLDHVKKYDAQGRLVPVVEMLSQTDQIYQTMPFKEANDGEGEVVNYRRAIPTPEIMRHNRGLVGQKGGIGQFTETVGWFGTRSEYAESIAKINDNSAEARASEEVSHLEGITNYIHESLFYNDNGENAELFQGLAPRFADTGQDMGGSQIVDAGGVGADNASIWLVGWGEMGVYGIFPKNAKTGAIDSIDRGLQMVDDGTGRSALVAKYLTDYEVKMGLVVKDYRRVARIANIDVSLLEEDPEGGAGAKLRSLIVRALHKVKKTPGLRWAFYAPPDVCTFLDLQAMNAASHFSVQDVGGEPITHFRKIPIYESDALLTTEAAIS